MKITAKLAESNSVVRKTILSALAQDVSQTINKSLPSIKLKIKDTVREAIKQEPEYDSLKNGVLRYEFGIDNSSSVDYIIDLLVDTIKVDNKTIKTTNQGLSGGFKITMIGTQDLNDVADHPYASVVDALRDYELPWLRWLLFEGASPIVKNYEVRMGPNENSRTGMAIMVESKSNWRVPSQFVGTVSNNWITRAFDRIDDSIENHIQKTILSNI